MARATRKRASSSAQVTSTPAVENSNRTTQHDSEGDAPVDRPLQFQEEIFWRPGKTIAVSVLLRRLKALSTELATFEQGEGGHQSFKDIAKALVNTQLLGHKDAGVRAWAMLCIAQVFSIAVPEAPYTASQLQDIFTVFTREVLSSLADFASPYKQQYIDTLTLLVEDRSIILILDVPDSEKMVVSLFKKTFDIMAGKTADETADELPGNIEYKLVKLLSEIIEEADGLEPEAVEVVLAQFMHMATYSGTHNASEASLPKYPSAYSVARSICNTCVTRMARYVSVYFSSVLINTSELSEKIPAHKLHPKKRGRDADDDDNSSTHAALLTADDLNDAAKAHLLLRELWRSCPDVVHGAIPQIEAELGAENPHLRTMAVELVGDMVSGVGAVGSPEHILLDPVVPASQLNRSAVSRWTGIFKPSSPYAFSAAYPICYQAFLDRSRDKSTSVRAAWATAVGRMISTDAGGKGLRADELNTLACQYIALLRDLDERVRLAATQAVASLELTPLLDLLQQEVGNGLIFANVLSERIQDPRHSIRKACIELLGRAWGHASDLLAGGDTASLQVLGDVPSQILEARFKNRPDLNQLVTTVLHDLLIPVTYPSSKAAEAKVSPAQQSSNETTSHPPTFDQDATRARRILFLVRGLTERGQSVFIMLQKLQQQLAHYLSALLTCCDRVTDDMSDSAGFRAKFNSIVEALSKSFPDQNVAFAHLQQLAGQDLRVRHLIRFCISPESDYSKVVKATKELRRNINRMPEDQRTIWDTLEPLLKAASVLIYNRSHVPAYTRYARTNEGGFAPAADLLIQGIASTLPEVLKIHITELCKDLQQSAPSSHSPGSSIATSSSLKACANFARRFPKDMPDDRAFYQAMNSYALFGSPTAAKHAISIILLAAPKKEMLVTKIAGECIKGFEYGAPQFLARLAALAQLRLLANEQTEKYADDIVRIATSDVLCTTRELAQPGDLEWIKFEDIDDDLSAKLLALKILVNSLRGKSMPDGNDSLLALQDVARPPYQLLNGLIKGDGELSVDNTTPKHHRAHLRLAAGISLLKLARQRTFDRFLSASDFSRLSGLCQDPRPEVRAEFGKALRKYLGSDKLPSRYVALAFLYALEPIKEIRGAMETWIRSRALSGGTNKHDATFETSLPVLLSLITHHEAFGTDTKDWEETAKYIVFYLKNIATPQNLPIISSLAQRIKTVQDGIDPAKSTDLYTVAEFAEEVIRAYQDEKGWSLQMSDNKARFPSGFFSALSNDVDSQALAEKRFLPDEVIEMVPQMVRAQLKTKRRKPERTLHAGPRLNGTVANIRSKRSSDEGRRGSKRLATPNDDDDGSDDDDRAPRYKKSRSSFAIGESTRRSSRTNTKSKNYVEADSDEDDEEMENWDKRMTDEENKENRNMAARDDSAGEDENKGMLADPSKPLERPRLPPNTKQRKKSVVLPLSVSQGQRKSTRTSSRHRDQGI